MNKIIDQTFKVAIYLRLSKEDDDLSCSSGAKSESNSISNQRKLIYDFMKSREISKAVILGFSDGANIAMKFAIRHPGMVKALILNGGNLNAAGVKRTTQLPIEIGYRVARHFAKSSPKAKRNVEMLGLMVNEPNIDPRELSRITAPTLVICGTRDMIRESHTREIAAGIPNAELTIIRGDHFIANKHPEAFNRAVDAFLKKLPEQG